MIELPSRYALYIQFTVDTPSQAHPEVEEWPAIATVWLCGGQTVTAATVPANELELKIIREVGTRFLDCPGVRPVWPHELRIPVQEQKPAEWVF